jgi:hypothetical protein
VKGGDDRGQVLNDCMTMRLSAIPINCGLGLGLVRAVNFGDRDGPASTRTQLTTTVVNENEDTSSTDSRAWKAHHKVLNRPNTTDLHTLQDQPNSLIKPKQAHSPRTYAYRSMLLLGYQTPNPVSTRLRRQDIHTVPPFTLQTMVCQQIPHYTSLLRRARSRIPRPL